MKISRKNAELTIGLILGYTLVSLMVLVDWLMLSVGSSI